MRGTGIELVGRVSRGVLALLVPVSIATGLYFGWSGVLGALAGGLISLVSLNWIARGVRSADAFFAGGRTHPMWIAALGLRYVLLFGAVGLLLGSGTVHPMALMVGLSILPPVLIVFGLRAAWTPPYQLDPMSASGGVGRSTESSEV
jgi:ATP synthase I chain